MAAKKTEKKQTKDKAKTQTPEVPGPDIASTPAPFGVHSEDGKGAELT